MSYFPTSTKSTPIEGSGTANVTTSSTTPIAANAARLEITLVNDSDTIIYIALGEAAVLNSGIRLNANGGSYTTGRYTGDVRAIHGSSGNKVLTWVEV